MNNPLSGTDPTGYCTGGQSVEECVGSLDVGETQDITDSDGNTIGSATLNKDGSLTVSDNNGHSARITMGTTNTGNNLPGTGGSGGISGLGGQDTKSSNGNAMDAKGQMDGVSEPESCRAPQTCFGNDSSAGSGGAQGGAEQRPLAGTDVRQLDLLANEVLDYINPISIDENREYGGLFYQYPDGQLGYTPPIRGSVALFNVSNAFGLVPPEAVIVGDYHTHGDYSIPTDYFKTPSLYLRTSAERAPQLDLFSDTDKATSFSLAPKGPIGRTYRSYLGTPSGDYFAYAPISPIENREYRINGQTNFIRR